MKLFIVKMQPKGPFSKVPTSETIFGAVCWGLRDLMGIEMQKYLEEFAENPKFIVSGANEYIGYDDMKVFFMPKPILQGLSKQDIDGLVNEKDEIKKKTMKTTIVNKYNEYKRITKIDSRLFFSLLGWGNEKNLEIPRDEISLFNMYRTGQEDYGFMLSENEITMRDTIQRSSVDRITMASKSEGGTFYSKQCVMRKYEKVKDYGLYFYILADETEFRNRIEPAFSFAAERGMGKYKSIGKGQFENISIVENGGLYNKANDSLDSKSKQRILAGRCVPQNNEISFSDPKTLYDIETIFSRIEDMGIFGTNLVKPPITIIKDGSSVVAENRGNYCGSLIHVKTIDVKKIYHNGIGMAFGFKEEDNK